MTLGELRFGGERFEFITKPEPSLRQVYDMVMDSQAILGESLFESGFRQRHQQGWDLLFERLTAAPDAELALELRELQDYRNYLQYDIRIHYPSGDRALLSQINAKKSGGETTTPFYVAMAASFAQAYRLNQPRPADTIRLALFDEAFGKMDTARTGSALKFMVENQLQVLLASKRQVKPPTKYLERFSDRVKERIQHPEPPGPLTWRQRLGLDADWKPAIMCAWGVALCAALLVGIMVSLNLFQHQVIMTPGQDSVMDGLSPFGLPTAGSHAPARSDDSSTDPVFTLSENPIPK
jgi:hypothetical protein